LRSRASGPPSFASMKMTPAFSSARCIASRVLGLTESRARNASPTAAPPRPHGRGPGRSSPAPSARGNIEPRELEPSQSRQQLRHAAGLPEYIALRCRGADVVLSSAVDLALSTFASNSGSGNAASFFHFEDCVLVTPRSSSVGGVHIGGSFLGGCGPLPPKRGRPCPAVPVFGGIAASNAPGGVHTPGAYDTRATCTAGHSPTRAGADAAHRCGQPVRGGSRSLNLRDLTGHQSSRAGSVRPKFNGGDNGSICSHRNHARRRCYGN
jgi:hypothetical protein